MKTNQMFWFVICELTIRVDIEMESTNYKQNLFLKIIEKQH